MRMSQCQLRQRDGCFSKTIWHRVLNMKKLHNNSALAGNDENSTTAPHAQPLSAFACDVKSPDLGEFRFGGFRV